MLLQQCLHCGKDFQVYLHEVKLKIRKYCGQSCAGHYKHPPLTVEDRFWKYANKLGPDDCWIWSGTKDPDGYGLIGISGRNVRAHRYSWELHKGQIPTGLVICHDCPGGDQPSCVNISHLFIGTIGDNLRDASKKGMLPKGESSSRSKLTDIQVLEIRLLFSKGHTIRDLARQFNVGDFCISSIVYGRRWRHLLPDGWIPPTKQGHRWKF